MLITTQDEFAEYEIVRTIGMVKGNTIRSRHIGKDILASLRTIVGGEIQEYTKMLAEAREQAIDRMIDEAKRRGADAVINLRFATSYVMGSASEILAYGDGVKLEKEPEVTGF